MNRTMRYPAGGDTMLDHGDPRLFRLHFKGAATEGHTLPAAMLVRAINSLQRIVRLLDSSDRSRQWIEDLYSLSAKDARSAVSRSRHRFELVCRTPEKGSFVQPVEIDHSLRYGARAADVALDEVRNRFLKVTEIVGKGSTDRLREIEPTPVFRELLLENYRAALPPIDTHIALSIENGHGRTILDGEKAMERIERLLHEHEVIERRDWTFRNVRYQADPPLRFQVNVGRDPRSRVYDLRGDFGIELSAELRTELEEALDSTLDMLWEEYAQEHPERLSGDARRLKFALLDRIRRI